MADVAPRAGGAASRTVDFRFVVGRLLHEQLRARLPRPASPERWSLEVLPFEQMRPGLRARADRGHPDAVRRGHVALGDRGDALRLRDRQHMGGGLANLIQDGENGLLTAPVAGQVEAALETVSSTRACGHGSARPRCAHRAQLRSRRVA
jgi:hypothetical protein